jgi:hypothetical protein
MAGIEGQPNSQDQNTGAEQRPGGYRDLEAILGEDARNALALEQAHQQEEETKATLLTQEITGREALASKANPFNPDAEKPFLPSLFVKRREAAYTRKFEETKTEHEKLQADLEAKKAVLEEKLKKNQEKVTIERTKVAQLVMKAEELAIALAKQAEAGELTEAQKSHGEAMLMNIRESLASQQDQLERAALIESVEKEDAASWTALMESSYGARMDTIKHQGAVAATRLIFLRDRRHANAKANDVVFLRRLGVAHLEGQIKDETEINQATQRPEAISGSQSQETAPTTAKPKAVETASVAENSKPQEKQAEATADTKSNPAPEKAAEPETFSQQDRDNLKLIFEQAKDLMRGLKQDTAGESFSMLTDLIANRLEETAGWTGIHKDNVKAVGRALRLHKQESAKQ